MAGFIGRADQMAEMKRVLKRIQSDTSGKPGKALIMRGRRRVGKSRLAEEFLEKSGKPGIFFVASKQQREHELNNFVQAVRESNIPDREEFNGVTFATWEAALTSLARLLPTDIETIIVIDELPYLMESDQSFEGTLQKVFDRELAKKPVLLILIGSDLAMMEALNEYGRPFHQRATELVVPPLSPAEVADMLELSPEAAFDAYLITGGLPLICQDWSPRATTLDFLKDSLSSSTSALIVSGERSLAAEFPQAVVARNILTAIGTGERTFGNIGKAAGGLTGATVNRSLELLKQKRVVAVERPYSTITSSETRYRVTDSYLRFWLSFIDPNMQELERGRGDRVLQKIQNGYGTWRGRAIEPVIRASIERIPNPHALVITPVVGAYWTRTNNPEVDIVIGDRGPVANSIVECGSIKWKEQSSFDQHDLYELLSHMKKLPGADSRTPMVLVSRSGFNLSTTTNTNTRLLGASDLLNAWR